MCVNLEKSKCNGAIDGNKGQHTIFAIENKPAAQAAGSDPPPTNSTNLSCTMNVLEWDKAVITRTRFRMG